MCASKFLQIDASQNKAINHNEKYLLLRSLLLRHSVLVGRGIMTAHRDMHAQRIRISIDNLLYTKESMALFTPIFSAFSAVVDIKEGRQVGGRTSSACWGKMSDYMQQF
jgi:hypothetical protein